MTEIHVSITIDLGIIALIAVGACVVVCWVEWMED